MRKSWEIPSRTFVLMGFPSACRGERQGIGCGRAEASCARAGSRHAGGWLRACGGLRKLRVAVDIDREGNGAAGLGGFDGNRQCRVRIGGSDSEPWPRCRAGNDRNNGNRNGRAGKEERLGQRGRSERAGTETEGPARAAGGTIKYKGSRAAAEGAATVLPPSSPRLLSISLGFLSSLLLLKASVYAADVCLRVPMDIPHQYGAIFQDSFVNSLPRQHFDPAIAQHPNWHRPQHPPTNQPNVEHQPMYPVMNNPSINHVDYASPSTSSFVHPNHPFVPHNQPGPLDASHALNLSGPQIEGSIGPNRVLTRRQARAALSHPAHREPSTEPGSSTENYDPQQQQPMFFMPHALSRPQTPDNYMHAPQYQQPPEPSMDPGVSPIGMQPHPQASPQYPPPSNAAGAYPYPYYPTHSRSTSGSANSASNNRSASPALSVASALTTVSSASGPNAHSFAPYGNGSPGNMSPVATRPGKQRKQRLFNVDRKAICVFHKENPTMRQEDIALRYGVERSTISKILKQKTKWMNVPEHEELRVAKHRPSKFPEIESELHKWLVECAENKVLLTDSIIRGKAKEVAKQLQIPDDKFKASSGWVENFKHRHGIKRGIWCGEGRNVKIARALGGGWRPDPDEPTELRMTLGDHIVKHGLYDVNDAIVPGAKVYIRPPGWKPGPPPPGQKPLKAIAINRFTGKRIYEPDDEDYDQRPMVESEDEDDLVEVPPPDPPAPPPPAEAGRETSPINLDPSAREQGEDQVPAAADTSLSSTSTSTSDTTGLSSEPEPQHHMQLEQADTAILTGALGHSSTLPQMTEAEFNYALFGAATLAAGHDDEVPDAAEAMVCYNKVMKYIMAHPEVTLSMEERKVLFALKPHLWGLGAQFIPPTDI